MSYPTEVEYLNLALNKIGQWSETDITANSHIAQLYRLHAPMVRRELLREHAWNFAIKRVQLTNSTLTNVFGEEYRYALPSDYLQTIKLYEDEDGCYEIDKFKIEGGAVLIDCETAYLRYIADITCTTDWSTDFVACAVLKLAARLAVPLGEGRDRAAELIQELEQLTLPQAKLNNSWEDFSGENNPTQDRINNSTYVSQNNIYI